MIARGIVAATVDVPPILTDRLDLVSMPRDLIEALLHRRLDDARSLASFSIPDGWLSTDDNHWLEIRLNDITSSPEHHPWLLRAMVDRETSAMVGHISFHGPPQEGSAELGYTVLEQHRRQGYAEEAIRGMMRWASEVHHRHIFRLSIAPDNGPSLNLAAKLGFTKTGEQIDPVDGLEYVYTLEFSRE
jgi:RimJ/RimL family protein N-acetyltransferase